MWELWLRVPALQPAVGTAWLLGGDRMEADAHPPHGPAHLINPHVWIRWYDCTCRKVHTLSWKVATEPALLAFEPLAEATHGLLGLHVQWDSWGLAVIQQCYLQLQEVPVFLQFSSELTPGRWQYVQYYTLSISNITYHDHLHLRVSRLVLLYNVIEENYLCQFYSDVIFVSMVTERWVL